VIVSTVPVNAGGAVTGVVAVVVGAGVAVVEVARAVVVVTATVAVALVAVVVDGDRRPTAFSVLDDPHAPTVSSVMAANAHARR
jgi:hypothetical protein